MRPCLATSPPRAEPTRRLSRGRRMGARTQVGVSHLTSRGRRRASHCRGSRRRLSSPLGELFGGSRRLAQASPPAARGQHLAEREAIEDRIARTSRRLRRALHALGLRFRVDLAIPLDGLRVRPDVVFTRRRVAVFVDGCFWHRCSEHGTSPRSNSDYWRAKLDRNVARDRRVDVALAQAGWRCVRVWEHEEEGEAAARVAFALSEG